jgi:hypothetical protein
MTETTTVTIEVEIPLIPDAEKLKVGEWMLLDALAYWSSGYDDEGNFQTTPIKANGTRVGYTVFDPAGMSEPKHIYFTKFFDEHLRLIWLAQIKNYRHDWIEFAFRSNDADYDEYDANTTDAVLQNMLYGEVIYG